MNETGNALRSCMEQLLVRDEKERIVIEAANKISSEKMKTHDLQHKFNDANKQFEKAIAENCNLRNIVDTKEKLIKDLKESKAHSDQKLADTTARLEFSQKQCTSLKYEVCMLQEELEIRNKEREYDLKSIHAAQKQRQESMKKIGALEAECQRLRTMVQKRLPGPTALAKMKDEVKRQGTSSAENGSRRPRAVVQPQPRARHTFSEGYQVKLQELGEENRHLIRQLLAQKESDLQFVQPKYVDEACKPSILQRQHEELCGSHVLTENKHPERMVSTLAKMDHSRSGKQHVSRIRSRGRRITGSDIQLLVDPLEIEKLERASRPSSAPHQCVDTPDTDSKMVVSETVHIDLVPDDGFSDKYPEWIQDVLEVIIHKHQVSKISVARIIDEVAHALRNEISAKGNHDAHLSYDRAEIDKIVATLTERVSNMVERSTKNNVTRFRSFFHEKYELTLQLGHLVHICSDILDGKANLGQLIVEVCLILEWIVSQCFLRLDLNAVDSVTNNSEGNESLRTLNIHEKDAMQSTKSEMAFGMQQEKQQELIETTEGQITIVTLDNHSQIELTCKLDEDLLAVIQGQGDSCQEKHPVYHETESSASDGRKEEIEEEGKQLKTTSAISAATKKLAECQKTITAPSKQLHALESPVNADASDKEKCGTLPPPVANLFAEADPKPEDLSPPTSEEATRIKEHSVSEPNATEKSPEHEAPGTGAKARKSGTTPIALRPMVPKSPRASVSADARKKKRRASLLSRLVFRKKA